MVGWKGDGNKKQKPPTHTQNHLLTHTRVCVLYSPENKKNNESKKKQKFSLSLCPKNEKTRCFILLFNRKSLPFWPHCIDVASRPQVFIDSLSLAWVVPLLCVKWMAVCSVYKVKESRRKWWGVCVVTLTPYGDRLSIYTAVSFPGTLLFLLVVVAFSQLFMADHKNAHHRFFGERVSSAFKKDKFFDLVLVVARAPIKDGGRQKSQAN